MVQNQITGLEWGEVEAHSRAAPQVRVIYLVAQAQPQLAAFLSQGPHGLPHCSCQHPQCLCGGKDLVSTRKWNWARGIQSQDLGTKGGSWR